jgi:DNA-binding helix-hairpin-helix protein with protein kinase domain
MLHERGVVVGDVSPNNLMVTRSGHITLIDCDEVQFTGEDGTRFSCPKRSPDHAPPEISVGGDWLAPTHDLFGLSILVSELLMEGEHPFVGVSTDQNAPDTNAAQNIQLQNNRITHPERFVTSSADIPLAVLPPRIRELAVRCFGVGHRDPDARPTARTWSEALDQAAWQLMGCDNNERHVFHNSLVDCVWCKLRAAGAGERYPWHGSTPQATPRWTVPVTPAPGPVAASTPAAAQRARRPQPKTTVSKKPATPAKRQVTIPWGWVIATILILTIVILTLVNK